MINILSILSFVDAIHVLCLIRISVQNKDSVFCTIVECRDQRASVQRKSELNLDSSAFEIKDQTNNLGKTLT